MDRALTQHLEQAAANPEALRETELWAQRHRERRDARLRREWQRSKRRRTTAHELRPLE